MKKQAAPLHGLTPLELCRKITVREAAEMNSISEQTFRRTYPHLVRKLGLRRDAVMLRDAIELPPRAAKQARA
jgi:hypothetical protein